MLDAWPFYLAYVVSFLTIGAAWLAHPASARPGRPGPARLNLLLLLVVAVLPFPALVAEGLDDVSGERVFVRARHRPVGDNVLLYAFDTYARWEHLFAPGTVDEPDTARRSTCPSYSVLALSILIGLALPALQWRCTAPSVLLVAVRRLGRLFVRRA